MHGKRAEASGAVIGELCLVSSGATVLRTGGERRPQSLGTTHPPNDREVAGSPPLRRQASLHLPFCAIMRDDATRSRLLFERVKPPSNVILMSLVNQCPPAVGPPYPLATTAVSWNKRLTNPSEQFNVWFYDRRFRQLTMGGLLLYRGRMGRWVNVSYIGGRLYHPLIRPTVGHQGRSSIKRSYVRYGADFKPYKTFPVIEFLGPGCPHQPHK